MDFDSPDVAKDFPGLYMGDAGKTLNDPADFEEDEKSRRKKEKKDKKDKGYAALAGESSPEEEELDPKSPGKAKKIKASFKLSAKKKDKKSIDKPDQDRKSVEKDKEKSSKKPEKDKKVTSEGEDKKSVLSLEKPKEKKSSDKEKDKKSGEKKKDEKKKKLSIDAGRGSVLGAGSPSQVTEKVEKAEKGLNLNQALNAFLNAPAPLLLKKEKQKNKDKDGLSSKVKDGSSSKVKEGSSSKVKLKLKRSKNSLEDSSSQSDLPFTVTHQFPEDPEAIAKEIKKYEALLEQTHSSIKSSKKVSKKSEEQLWELQRTLTQLKRKLRSINALSVSSPATVPSYPQVEPPKKSEPVPIPLKEDAIIKQESPKPEVSKSIPTADSDEMAFDFTLKTPLSSPPEAPPTACSPEPATNSGTMSPLKQEIDLNPQQPAAAAAAASTENNKSLSPYVPSDPGSSNSNLASITPEAEVQRLQVEVQIHQSAAENQSPVPAIDDEDEPDGKASSVTPEVKLNSSVIKALTFSDEEIDEDDADDGEEITDVSSLSLRNTNAENENSFLDDGVDMTKSQISQDAVTDAGMVDPFEMPVFDSEEYLTIENEALIFFNEELQEQIQKEEGEIDELMKQLEHMSTTGVDIDAPEIALDLDQFEFDELVSLWQITKLENEALNEQVNHLRQMVALSRLEEFRLETRLKYLEDKTTSGRNCNIVPTTVENENYIVA